MNFLYVGWIFVFVVVFVIRLHAFGWCYFLVVRVTSLPASSQIFLSILVLGNVFGVDILITRKNQSTVITSIQTNNFFKRIRSEPSLPVQPNKEWEHGDQDPSNHKEATNYLGSQQMSIAVAMVPRIKQSIMWHFLAIGQFQFAGSRKESHRNQSKKTIKHVDGNRIDGIVQAHSDQPFGSKQIQPTSHGSNDNRCPGFDHSTSRSNGHKSRE
mmetsp:Transcript_7526/g.18113  ORF Transcript_7526/g.18113 Transcript_7526/m.18113 type:complete len:213 (+) Transcript_7526:153-791(+)